ncbi:MAG: peptidyl-prolyl cis-trans isomerase [Deltaproteobacteria bacterium]|nr:peptidyl-prolyl cis-trans isomerase [Deltaproteobacteria bacterium]
MKLRMTGTAVLTAIGAVFATVFAMEQAHAAVLAQVGAKTITDDEVRAEYASMDKDQKKAVNSDAATKKSIVDNAVNSELIIQAAQKAGLENDAEYKKSLERFRRQYLASKMMEKSIEPKLGKAEIRKYYESNKNLFDSSEACASHIVVTDEATAQKIAGEAKGKGAKFEELAKKYSVDPSVRDNGGNLGCFTRDRMVPEFSAAAFAMSKGQIKGPIRTMYGFHVIKLNGVKPGKVPGFEEVEQRAKDAYRMKLLRDMIADLRAKSSVQVNDEAVKSLKF